MLKINNKEINGKVSIKRKIKNEKEYEIEGVILTDIYIEEINTLETSKFKIKNIIVTEENFGSEDNNILYTFNSNNIQFKFKKIEEGYYEFLK